MTRANICRYKQVKGEGKLGEKVTLVFSGTFLVLVLKVLCPWKALSPGQTGTVGHTTERLQNVVELVLSALVKSISKIALKR